MSAQIPTLTTLSEKRRVVTPLCGIAGQYSFADDTSSAVKAITLEKMCMAMHHRGPDHQGLRMWSKASLGYRRLSILDLSEKGFQPMIDETESLATVYNGEIYNFRELRTELMQRSHRFRSDSDSEVVMRSFLEWREDALVKFEGMFAFAAYEPEHHRLTLVRDPFGIKPLYYIRVDDDLFFASEIRCLFTIPGVRAHLNPDALAAFLTLGYVPGPETMFEGVVKLPPGHTLIAENGEVSIRPYWNLLEATTGQSSNLTSLKEKLQDSVRGSLLSDVPIGVYLSGGLDSTLISMLAQEASHDSIRTFSIGFTDANAYDESSKSNLVANILKTEHHALPLNADAARVLPKAVLALEEPLADASIIPTFHLAQTTKSFVTVALSGEGGDELYGGYLRYFWEPLASSPIGSMTSLLAPLLLPLLERLSTPHNSGWSRLIRRSRKFLQTSQLEPFDRYLSWFALTPKATQAELLEHRDLESWIAGVRQFYDRGRSADPLQRLQYFDINTMLVENLLLKADKLGMAHSLEVRVPLLNRTVAENAFSLPRHLKINRRQTKVAMRRLLSSTFPSSIVNQAKQGFEVPVGDWMKKEGKFLLDELADGDDFLFPKATIRRILDEHNHGKRDHGWCLFALTVLKLWIKEFQVSVP